MRSAPAVISVILLSWAWSAPCQETPRPDTQRKAGVPIYDVTVVERTTKAINYAYRSGPTKIDFRGTVLLPQAKGEATVESLRGRTEIDAKFEHLLPTTRFGHEYLTYSLWAITPQGAAHNIGEIVPDGSDKAKLHVTTDLQAFGLIVTAEPYSAARRPSDVVVMENEVRPDTVGHVETIDAKYELLPRGQYTWEVPAQIESGVNQGPKVSMNEYEAILELYEAQNAVGIARAAGAGQYAPDTLAKAQNLLDRAQQMKSSKAPLSNVVEAARESAQTAEDARTLTETRRTAEKLAAAQKQASALEQAQQQLAQARAEAAQARLEAEQALAQGEANRQRADTANVAAEQPPAPAQPPLTHPQVAPPQPAPPQVAPSQVNQPPQTASSVALVESAGPSPDASRQLETRRILCQELNGYLPTLDTPRGIVVTVPDTDFNWSQLKPEAASLVAQVAGPLAAHAGLQIRVEGYWDSEDNALPLSQERADNVRGTLLRAGIQADRISSEGMGGTRPIYSNATATGREANRRVEVVITGGSIGSLPVWDKPYTISPK